MSDSSAVYDEVASPDGRWEIRRINGIPAGVAFRCPGCGAECYVGIERDGHKAATEWTFDGNLDAPTLSPSLLNKCCGWHGYLTAGKFRVE